MFGLRETDIEEICRVFRQFTQVECAIIFGSRAKGNYRNGSDVDIALKGHIPFNILISISSILNEETMMPYRFDILDYDAITNPDLVLHIDRVGKLLYSNEKPPALNEPTSVYTKFGGGENGELQDNA